MTSRLARDVLIRARAIRLRNDALDAGRRGSIDADLYGKRDALDGAKGQEKPTDEPRPLVAPPSQSPGNGIATTPIIPRPKPVMVLPDHARLRRMLLGMIVHQRTTPGS